MISSRIRAPKRPNMRRVVILFPSGFTLGNLFFGIFAMITASRGDFHKAGIFVMIGGICDALDGRVARATNAGSQFGEELDSLVDAISFGLAPAMIMYFAVLNRDGWDWIFVFLFAACAVMRLARFNIEQAGTAKTYFRGLPSPAAGITLASYYWFSQSWMYNYTSIGDLPWQEMLRFIMAALAMLMISPVPYPVVPRWGFRSVRALGASLLVFGSIALLLTGRLEYFFPLCLIYVVWGPVRWIFSGLFERRQPTVPYDLSEGEDDDEEDEEELDVGTSQAHASRQATREPRLPREDRTKKPRGREEGAERPPRTEERPAKIDRPERAERPERTERPERPQRTDDERAARREKREKRDKREGRPERVPRPPRTDRIVEAVDIATGVTALTLGEPTTEAATDDEVIGSIAGTPELVTSSTAIDPTAPPRKRKRRRRRGERKERAPGDTSAPTAAGDDGADGGDDGGFDDGPDDSSPYSPPAFPASMPPIPAPVPAPAPAPSPSPTSREPNE